MEQLDQSVHKLTYNSRQATWLVSAADTSQWAGLQYTHFRITVLNGFNETGRLCCSSWTSFRRSSALSEFFFYLEADFYFANKVATIHFHKQIYMK